jgi:hypothetical protein
MVHEVRVKIDDFLAHPMGANALKQAVHHVSGAGEFRQSFSAVAHSCT